MEVDDFPPIDPNVDYEKILPIHQKRIIAFINHFLTNTVSFLNTFAQSCESRLMEFEYKMQKVEASLLILESQLSSISSLNNTDDTKDNCETREVLEQKSSNAALELPEVVVKEVEKPVQMESANVENQSIGHKTNQDPRYTRFFKMIQFGVPVPAVKLKMVAEGIDPNILDKPNDVVTDYIIQEKHESSSNSSSSS